MKRSTLFVLLALFASASPVFADGGGGGGVVTLGTGDVVTNLYRDNSVISVLACHPTHQEFTLSIVHNLIWHQGGTYAKTVRVAVGDSIGIIIPAGGRAREVKLKIKLLILDPGCVGTFRVSRVSG